MTPTTQQLGLREVLQLKPVRRLWLAQLVSVFGDFLAIFAVITHVSFNLHASATEVTLISVSFLLPFAVIGPVVGVFVDRWNVKRTMIASDLIRAGLVLLLIAAGNLGGVYAILFALSVVSTFFVPAQTVALRTITPPEGLMSANALMQQAMQMVRIVSPALAAAMVGWFGAGSCYLVDCASFFLSAALLSTLLIAREPVKPPPGSHPVRAVLDDLKTGVAFIFTHASLAFAILAMAAALFAISCFGPLLAVYVRDAVRVDPPLLRLFHYFQETDLARIKTVVFGIINALIGVGMIGGTLVTNRFARNRSKNHLVLLGLLTMGAFVLLLAGVQTALAAAVSMLGVGVGVVFVIVSAQTMMQGQTPMELVGRVSSSVWAVLSIAQLLGLIFSGSMAQRIGVTNVFYASAAMLVLMTVLGYFSLPEQTPAQPVAAG